MFNVRGIIAIVLFFHAGQSFSKGSTIIITPPTYLGGYYDPMVLPDSPIAPFLPNMGYLPPNYYGIMMMNQQFQARQNAIDQEQAYEYQQALKLREYIDNRDNQPAEFNTINDNNND